MKAASASWQKSSCSLASASLCWSLTRSSCAWDRELCERLGHRGHYEEVADGRATDPLEHRAGLSAVAGRRRCLGRAGGDALRDLLARDAKAVGYPAGEAHPAAGGLAGAASPGTRDEGRRRAAAGGARAGGGPRH